MANRVYLLALHAPPVMLGAEPPEGAVAIAKWSMPFFWATLFDPSCFVGPYPGGLSALATPFREGYIRSQTRLRALYAELHPDGQAVVPAWFAFLDSLQVRCLAIDPHDLGVSDPELRRLIERAATAPNVAALVEDFSDLSTLDGQFAPQRLAGFDLQNASPPRPHGSHSIPPPSSMPGVSYPPMLAARPVSVPPAPAPFDWDHVLSNLLAESDPAAWTRYAPHATPSSFRADVAVAAPGVYFFYDARVSAWTVLWASCSYAATEVFGVPIPKGAPNVFYPPLPFDAVGLEAPPLSYERIAWAARNLGQPVVDGQAPRPNQPPFHTLVDDSTITYFLGGRGPSEPAVAVLFRGSPTATPI